MMDKMQEVAFDATDKMLDMLDELFQEAVPAVADKTEAPGFLSALSLGDIASHAPTVVLGLIMSILGYKLLRCSVTGYKMASSAPGKTFGVVGLLTSLFATPVAFSRLADTDMGMAMGSVGVGAFLALMSTVALIKGRSPENVMSKKGKQTLLSEISAATAMMDAAAATGNTEVIREARTRVENLAKHVV